MKRYRMAPDYLRAKKGISPLIAAVLLIALVVALGSLYAGWFASLVSSTTQSTGNKTVSAIDCASARVSITDVHVDFESNVSRITARNSGQSDDMIVSAAIFNSHGVTAANLSPIGGVIRRGDIITFEFDMSGVLASCGNFSRAVVSTRCRTETSTATPKGC